MHASLHLEHIVRRTPPFTSLNAYLEEDVLALVAFRYAKSVQASAQSRELCSQAYSLQVSLMYECVNIASGEVLIIIVAG